MRRRVRQLIGVGAVVGAAFWVLGASPDSSRSRPAQASSIQLLIAAAQSDEEPGVWSIGLRAFDRLEDRLLTEPVVTIEGDGEVTFQVGNPRTGELVRLVVSIGSVN